LHCISLSYKSSDGMSMMNQGSSLKLDTITPSRLLFEFEHIGAQPELPK
jgi:hypothetical protein